METAKTSKIVSGMAKVKEGSMVEVNWDAANPSIPAKIIALAGVIVFILKYSNNNSFSLQGSSLFLVLMYNLRFLAQKDHTCYDWLILRQFLHLHITTKG